MKRLILTLCLLLSVPTWGWAAAETLYVRPAGGSYGTEDGTSYANAFDGFANILVNATDETAGQVDPGDTLYICGQHSTMFTYGDIGGGTTGSGVAGNRITISWDCPGDPGSIVGASIGNGFRSQQNYVDLISPVISGIFTGAAALNLDTVGSVNTQVRQITITNGTISSPAATCISAYGKFVTITGTTISSCGFDGIFTNGTDVRVSFATISLVSTASTTGDCIQGGGGQFSNVIFEHNTCDHSNVDTKYCYIISDSAGGGMATIRYNSCVRLSTDTIGSGIYVATGSAEIYGNTVTGGQHGIECTPESGQFCTIYGNTVRTANDAGIKIGFVNPSGTSHVLSNTIIGADASILNDTHATGIVSAVNNILVGAVNGMNKTNASTFTNSHNLFYQISGNNYLDQSVPTTPGTGSLLATDPLFINTTTDLRTLSTSPARRAGASGYPCSDVRGRPCWLPPDIGAYQATSGDPAATRTPR